MLLLVTGFFTCQPWLFKYDGDFTILEFSCCLGLNTGELFPKWREIPSVLAKVRNAWGIWKQNTGVGKFTKHEQNSVAKNLSFSTFFFSNLSLPRNLKMGKETCFRCGSASLISNHQPWEAWHVVVQLFTLHPPPEASCYTKTVLRIDCIYAYIHKIHMKIQIS